MPEDYRRRLFGAYDKRMLDLRPDVVERVRWFGAYARRAYLVHLQSQQKVSARVLDIGCSEGALLSALHDAGFRKLEGIDVSVGDIDLARRWFGEISFHCVDARDFLPVHPAEYDVIVMKAVLEHVPKTEAISLLQLVRDALRPAGLAIIDVPNMDWLFAGHERYMDFTHEAGYTQESLRQVVGSIFDRVEVFSVDNDFSHGMRRLRTRAARATLGTLLRWADPDGGSGPIWERSIVAVARV